MSYLGRTIKEGAKALQFIIGETHGTAIRDIAVSKAKSMFGTFTPDGNMLYTRAKKLSMKSVEQEKKDITVVIDGEPIGILPATFQVHSNALNLKM